MEGGCGAATGSPETFPQAGALQQDLVEGMGGVVGENGGLCPAVGKGERQSMFKGARQEGDGELGEQWDNQDLTWGGGGVLLAGGCTST